MVISYLHGGVAQLGERLTGSQKVNGSIPSVSTNKADTAYVVSALFFYNRGGSEPPSMSSGMP